jgi:hypothetical protein
VPRVDPPRQIVSGRDRGERARVVNEAHRVVLVRTVGMFELTFLTAGPDSQTLVVALYYSMSAAGIRPSSRLTPWPCCIPQ